MEKRLYVYMHVYVCKCVCVCMVHVYVSVCYGTLQKGKVSGYEFLIIEKDLLATERNLLLLDSTF